MKKFLKEDIYGGHGRRWHKSTGTWFQRNKNEIIIFCVLVAALTFAYFAY